MPTPTFSGAASLKSLRFHQLALKHHQRWKGKPTIVDAYLDKFHGQGRVLVVNVGPNRRVTLKNGFTAYVDQPVNRKNLRACQWKGKEGKHSRLRWTKHGESIRGRDTTKLKVECGQYSIGVTSAPTGLMYGFKEDAFARGIYITTNTTVEFVSGDGSVHSVQIRRKKKSSEPMDKVVRVLGINVQTAKVSEFATSQGASPDRKEYPSSDDSHGYNSEENIAISSCERGKTEPDFSGNFLLNANTSDQELRAFLLQGGVLSDVEIETILKQANAKYQADFNTESRQQRFEYIKKTISKKIVQQLVKRIPKTMTKWDTVICRYCLPEQDISCADALFSLSLHDAKAGEMQKSTPQTPRKIAA